MSLGRAPTPVAALLLALLVLIGLGGGAEAQSAYLAGVYDSAGTNPDGSTYQGVVVIEHHAGLLSLEWDINGQVFFGVGKVSRRQLIVNWGQQSPVIYDLDVGGDVLRGTWASGQGSEVLTRR
ncbi:MAG: fibronectin-binding protein [Alphaproteobacteria bacterium]